MSEYVWPKTQASVSVGSVKVSNVLVPENYDTILADYSGINTDVYTYKSSGATVAIVTITYTDGTKAVISSVVRS